MHRPTKTFGIFGRRMLSGAIPTKAGLISLRAARCSALATRVSSDRQIGATWVEHSTPRLDVHPSGVKVSIFAASVINTVDGRIDPHIQGNKIYGIYSSFALLIPHATLEPYVVWRV